MSNKRVRKIITVAIFTVVSVALTLGYGNSHAASNVKQTSKKELAEKAMIQGLKSCYENKAKAEVSLGANSEFSMNSAMPAEGTVVLPYMMKNTLSQPKLNCNQLMTGEQSNGFRHFDGIINYFGKSSLASQYEPWGYISTGGSNQKCISFAYELETSTSFREATSNFVCMNTTGEGEGSVVYPKTVRAVGSVAKKDLYLSVRAASSSTQGMFADGSVHTIEPECGGKGGSVVTLKYKDTNGKDHVIKDKLLMICEGGLVSWNKAGADKMEMPDELKNAPNYNESIARQMLEQFSIEYQLSANTPGVPVSATSKTRVTALSSNMSNQNVVSSVKLMDNGTESGRISSARKALRTLTGKSDAKFSDYKFKNYDFVSLDLKYIQSMMDKYPNILKLYDDDKNCGTKDEVKNRGFDIVPVKKEKDGKKMWCRIAGVENVSKTKLNNKKIFSIEKNETSLKLTDFQGVVDDLETRSVADFKTSSLVRKGKSQEEKNEDEDGSSEKACQQAAGSLSWIICPVAETLNNATQGIYASAIEPILQVNADALRTDGGSNSGHSDGVYIAWAQFRNIANVIFAVALALVILSQLTGFGLSNYGIKKILPRLIMVIVLVNISFILCQLMVDISNVLGSGLNTLMTDWAKKIFSQVGESGSNFFGGYILGEIMDKFLNAGVAGTLGVIGVSVAMNWDVWLIPLLLVLITFLLSVLFFFIILAVRQAGIFILIALAPVAIVCYALPNTKSLFDKWYKLFMALLIAYPICGLMMGGGQFASALLMQVGAYTGSGGFFMLLTAVVVSVAPFFLIPGIIKNSMGALGNIGMKLSNFGSKAGNFLGGMFVGSRLGDSINRRAKARTNNREETRAYNAQTRQLNRDRKYLNRMQRRQADGGRLSHRQQERVGRLTSRVLSTDRDRNAAALQAGRMFSAGGIDNMLRDRRDSQQEEMRRADIANALARYSHMTGAAGEPVDYNQLEAAVMRDANGDIMYDNNGNVMRDLNDRSNEAEYNRQLDLLEADPTNVDALTNVSAWQQKFASQGDHGRAIIQRAFERRLTNGQTNGIGLAAREISRDDKFLGAMKGADRGLFAMVNDAASGSAVTGANAASHYGAMGTDKYTAQSLANADEGAIDRLVAGAESGNIKGAALNNLAASAREALANDNIQVKPEMEGRLRQLAAAGYAQGASKNASSTAGSNALARSSARDIDSAAAYIRSANGGSKFGASANASNSAEYKMVQGMAQNAQTALKDSTKTYTQEQVKSMQDVIKAARDMGVSDDTGHTFDAVDSASIQVRGVEPRAIPTRPANFDEHGNFRDIANPTRTPTAAEQEAFNQYVRERAAAERYNQRHGFNNPSGGNT